VVDQDAAVDHHASLMTTLAQVRDVAAALATALSCLVPVFAGRTADTGRDPVPIMAAMVRSKFRSARFIVEMFGHCTAYYWSESENERP
jgi:hypothetical protein